MFKHKYFEVALADGPAGGSPATAPAAPAPDAPSTLASVAAPSAPAANSLDWVQAKYIVKDAAGVVDEAASIRKQAESYNQLASRMGTDELRPEKVDGYTLTAPEGLDKVAFDEYVKDPDTAKFIEGAHAVGYNSKQLQYALEAGINLAGTLEQGDVQSRDDGTKAYVAANMWKDEAAQKAGFTAVLGAVDALAAKTGINRDAFTIPLKLPNGVTLPPAINDPRVLALLSAIAPELKTGHQPAGTTLPAADLESLTKSPAYMDPNHKDHLATKQKVAAHFASLPGASEKAKGPVVIDTSRR